MNFIANIPHEKRWQNAATIKIQRFASLFENPRESIPLEQFVQRHKVKEYNLTCYDSIATFFEEVANINEAAMILINESWEIKTILNWPQNNSLTTMPWVIKLSPNNKIGQLEVSD